MKKTGDAVAGLPEVQQFFSFGGLDVVETAEKLLPPFQLKFAGETVAKRNDFIRCRVFMRGGKDPIAYRLFAHFVAALHSRKDDEMGYCQVKVRDFMPDSGGKDYSRAREAMLALTSLVVERHTNERQVIDIVFSGSFVYDRSNGTVTAKLNPELKPFFLKLYENYTTYGLLEFTGLSSFYSQRLFEIACSMKPKTEETFPLRELQRMLNVIDGTMLRYSNFKQKALEPAKKEINDKTNVKFDYVPIKNGRSVAEIRIKARRMGVNPDDLLDE